jgi:cyclin A
VEKPACDFFVESLEVSTACEALAFAAAHSVGGEHARGLEERCVGYVVDHFAECSAEPSFLQLPCGAVAEVIGSDDLPVEETAVLAAVRAWFDHDEAARAGSLSALLPLVRWPLLPVEVRLQLSHEPLLQGMIVRAPQLGMQLLLELTAEFAASDAAAACPRLKRRKGTKVPVLPLAFIALSQQKYRPDPQYMTRQNDINSNMRGILVDWLVEVSEQYKLHTETLFLSINYIDRFLSRNNVQRGKLQLVGITCMLVAAKYEEIYPPSVEDFVYISDNAYSREQVIAEEVKLLNALKFHCTVATSRQFLRRFAKAARADHTTHEMAHYLAELSLLDITFVKYPPSVIAAAAILIAINTTHLFGYGNLNWDATMQYYTTYSFEDLEPCAKALLATGKASYSGTSQFRAVKKKYTQPKFDNVATRRLCEAVSA